MFSVKNLTSLGYSGLVFLFAAVPTPQQWLDHCQGHPQVEVQSWIDQTSRDFEWKSLLHFFDQSSSDALPSSFFISPEGIDHADIELKTTVCEMLAPTKMIAPLQVNVACAFPARKFWLKQKGVPVPDASCKEFEDFFDGIKPKSLTYVYSSAYPNNPASMFGHTFIRVNQGNQDPLLDYGVNYAALVPPDEPGYVYIPLGLMGLYPGIFQVSPYYRKVLEYTQAESRDLWEYDLNLSEAETQQWVRHLFELRFMARFRYSFLKQNCSYQLIRSVQAVKPSLYAKIGNGLYVLPAHTIEELKEADSQIVGSAHYRPSLFKIVQHRYHLLNEEQRNQFLTSRANPIQIASINDPEVLETLTSFYDYQKINEQYEVKPETAEHLRTTRVTRARLGGRTRFKPLENDPTRTNQPDLGHDTRAVGLFWNRNTTNTQTGLGLSLQMGLHDLLDRDLGYETTFSVKGLEAQVMYNLGSKHFELNEATFFEIISLQAIESTQFHLSWNVGSRFERITFEHLSANTGFNVYGGPGITTEWITDHLYVGLFLNAEFWIESEFARGFELFLAPTPWILWRVNDHLKFYTRAPVRIRYDGSNSYFNPSFEGAWSFSRNTQLRVGVDTIDNDGIQVQSGVRVFF